MVVHALHQVTHQFGVEERHGEFQQFDEEIGYERDVDAHADVKQYPAADEVHAGAADGQYKLPQQDKVYDAEVLMGDAYIYDGLCEEGEDELQQAAHQSSQYDLSEISAILFYVTKQKLKGTLSARCFSRKFVESGCGLNKHGYSFFFPFGLCADPVISEFFFAIGHQSLSRIGDVEFLSFLYFVEDDKMVLAPVQNAGQGCLGQLLHGYPSANGMQAQLVCRFADAQQGYAFGGGEALTGKRLQGIFFSVVLAYHLQAGDAALHAVVLFVPIKFSHRLSSAVKNTRICV